MEESTKVALRAYRLSCAALGEGSFLDYLLVLVRGLISFLALVVFLRLLGKQQLSELSLIDFVISITIGSIASSATVDTDNPSIYTVFGIIVWSVLALLLMHTQLYNRWFNVIMHGQPKVLVEGGRIDKHALRQEKLTFDDLLMLRCFVGPLAINRRF